MMLQLLFYGPRQLKYGSVLKIISSSSLRTMNALFFSFVNKFAAVNLKTVNGVMQKLKNDVMGNHLRWKVLLESADGKKYLSYEDGRMSGLSPWFGTESDVEEQQSNIAKNQNIEDFLKSI
mmetsp:Transcript_33588/g.41270  ORF Transcript_33588/g.41270 Transcript_33588/m.41270 type:complete len:121 (+) Transcript_33588:588-950(+)